MLFVWIILTTWVLKSTGSEDLVIRFTAMINLAIQYFKKYGYQFN